MLVKPKYLKTSCCVLLHNLSSGLQDETEKCTFSSLVTSKPSACGRMKCVSGGYRPERSPFIFYLFIFLFSKQCCRADFLFSIWTVDKMFCILQMLKLNFCFFLPTAEAASRAIVQFLEVNQSEEASRGWMLLTTINLLASSGQVSLNKA